MNTDVTKNIVIIGTAMNYARAGTPVSVYFGDPNDKDFLNDSKFGDNWGAFIAATYIQQGQKVGYFSYEGIEWNKEVVPVLDLSD